MGLTASEVGMEWKREKVGVGGGIHGARGLGGEGEKEKEKKSFFLENDKWVRVLVERIIVKVLNEAHNYPLFLTCYSQIFFQTFFI